MTDDGQTLGDFLASDPTVVPSKDGQAALAVFNLRSDVFFQQSGDQRVGTLIVDNLREAWKEAGAGSGIDAYLTGPAGIGVDTIKAFGGIDESLLYTALIAVLVILLLVYRSPVLPFMVLGTAVFALGIAALVVYVLADHGVLTLNGQSQGIMSILVVGATTDYALLLVSRYREELRRHASAYEAMQFAWRRAIEPIIASAVTVILGLLTLLLSDLSSNQSLGPVASIGIASAVLAALTLLPGLLLIAGKRSRGIFWPKKPTFDSEDAVDIDSLASVERHAGVWGRISRGVAAHPRRTWVAALVGLGILASFAPTFAASGVGRDETITGEVESVDGLAVLADHFDAGATDPIEIVASQDDWQQVLVAATSVDGVSGGYALTPAVIKGAPGGVVQEDPVVVDGRVALDVVTVVNSSSQEAKDLVIRVREAVHAVDPSALVGGTAAVSLDINDTTDRDLLVIVPTVLLVIFLVLTVLLRAVLAPLIIVAANVLSFAATIGISALVFNHVFHFPGADPAVPLFGFVFLVALGIDYSIFLMSRVREESLARGTREGVRRGLAVTGGVITSAGIVLAATFAALGVLPLLFLQQIAFIVAMGVLVDTLVVRTLLVPGVIYDVGRAAWWPWRKNIQN